MNYCRICTQHNISRYVFNGEQIRISYIAITSETDHHPPITSEIDHHPPITPSCMSGYCLLKPHLQHDESPQKSSWYLVTLPNDDGLSLDQTIWSQHGQVWTLMGLL
jgi:hypothetical protein